MTQQQSADSAMSKELLDLSEDLFMNDNLCLKATELGLSEGFYKFLYINELSPNVQENILKLIINLTTVDQNIEFFLNLQILPVMQKLLNSNMNLGTDKALDIIRNVILVLANIAGGKEEQGTRIVQSNILRTVLKICKIKKDQKEILCESKRLIHNLLSFGNIDNDKIIMQLKIVNLYVKCLKCSGDPLIIIDTLMEVKNYIELHLAIFNNLETLKFEFFTAFGEVNLNELMRSANGAIADLATKINGYFNDQEQDIVMDTNE
ncbi:MAG: hypothetical protein MJ252_24125 [archaeon]|nr:hypothetical protein [archaeon]